MKRGQKGFTMIEMMAVMVVMLILAAIAVPNLVTAARTAAQGSARRRVQGMYTLVQQSVTCQSNCNYVNAMIPSSNTPVLAGGYSYVFQTQGNSGQWSYTATPLSNGVAAGAQTVQIDNTGALTCGGNAC